MNMKTLGQIACEAFNKGAPVDQYSWGKFPPIEEAWERAAQAVATERCSKLAAWLKWCLECNGDADNYFGTDATGTIERLLAGDNVEMP
jgi:hypothetical protein